MQQRLLTVHHKRDTQLPLFAQHFDPIQVGAARTDVDLQVLRDDAGPNISDLNPYFCELTALYWQRHQPPVSGVGLMHYRRMFVTGQRRKTFQADLTFIQRKLQYRLGLRTKRPERHTRIRLTTPDAVERHALAVKAFLNAHPDRLIVPEPVRFIGSTIADIYGDAHHRADFDAFVQALRHHAPALTPELDALPQMRHYHNCNMFVLPWSIFTLYCDQLFPALMTVYQDRDMADYAPYQSRVFGFLAERFMGIFIAHVLRTQRAKITYLPVAFCDLS